MSAEKDQEEKCLVLPESEWAQMSKRQRWKFRKYGIVPAFLKVCRGYKYEEAESRKKIYKRPAGPLWEDQQEIFTGRASKTA
jgi:hypothetical protein